LLLAQLPKVLEFFLKGNDGFFEVKKRFHGCRDASTAAPRVKVRKALRNFNKSGLD
jgi:hypothetical protein